MAASTPTEVARLAGVLPATAGFFFLLPFPRPLTRRELQAVAERRLLHRSGIIRGEVS